MMNKYTIKVTGIFKKDLKQIEKWGYNIKKLNDIVEILASGNKLHEKYKDHNLTGNYKGYRECHIEPDWLLVYKIENNILVLTLSRTGTHSDLFRK